MPDVATQHEWCVEVHLKHLIPVVFWELVGGVAPLDTGAVEEDVESGVGEDGGVSGEEGDNGGDGGGVGEVRNEDSTAPAEGGDGVMGCRVVGIAL